MASPPNTPQTTDASHPFKRPSADIIIILRSCDLVDFHVHSFILTEASPFFSGMFELPQPSQADSGTPDAAPAPPVIDMAEDAETLDLLLRLLYPIVKPPLEEPKLLARVLKAATKYEMAWPVTVVSERLLAITSSNALQVWAAACQARTGLEGVARQAALVLRVSGIGVNLLEVETLAQLKDCLEDMFGISAGDYLRLKQFLRAAQSDIDAGRLTLLSPQPEAMTHPPLISPSPFSTDLPSPDVSCRSLRQRGLGSEQSFKAHSLILSMRSPVLKARLGLVSDPLPALGDANSKKNPSGGTLAVLEFDEEPEIVSLLLKVCYNDQEDLPVDLELTPIAELLRACGKYQMIRIEDLVRAAWNKIAISRPLEAFFVAICQGLDDCARAAAKNVLSGPIPDAYTPVMESAPALAYHRLLVYYDACRAVRKERLVAFKNRIPSSFYVHDRGRFFSDGVQKAIHEFAEGTHGVAPHMGYPKHALPNVLTNAMSTNSTLRRSQVWEFIEILVEGVTSVPDVVAAAIDEVQIELA
ncbi:hypothetical protein TRAPUB_6820 [Trametes pubescens]|uniref:BTB domain-containing protein n=1 Tax=Trametes pubescens TaxID=154538 RepID=A0A1M2V4U9_TRAPU|nr:hypothetical protein TRAPUB_6820 [Trametes pubescens]